MAQHAAAPAANHHRGHHGDEPLPITEARSLPAGKLEPFEAAAACDLSPPKCGD
jgi:hypothetical protein